MRRDSITAHVASKSAVVLAALILVTSTAGAQGSRSSQYQPPGSIAERPGDDQERLESEMDDSLWQVGPFRLNPWIGITRAAFVTNTFATTDTEPQENDFTITLGAGVTGIVPFGEKVFLTLEAIPQYVFWLNQTDRKTSNQWYGTRLYGFYNRLYLEGGVSRRDAVRVVSSEFEQETNTRIDLAEALAEVRFAGAFHLFTGAARRDISTLEAETDPRLANFSRIDRDENVLRAGLRYRPRDSILVGAGIESGKTEFAPTARELSNSGQYPFLEVLYEAPEFFVTADVSFLDLEPDGPTSEFVPISDPTWTFQLTTNPGWRFDYTPYARTHLFYAVDEGYTIYMRSRYGLRVGAILVERWNATVFVETGADDYQRVDPSVPNRKDDVVSWGLNFTFDVSKRFDLTFGYTITNYSSSLPENDRDTGRLILNFGVSQLTLGRR